MDVATSAKIAWDEGRPWLVSGAVDKLEEIVQPDYKVFEWGAGGSTIWYGRQAAEVISVEHDPSWYAEVEQRLRNEGLSHVTLWLALRPDGRVEYDDYVNIISDCSDGEFDIIQVDGRARVWCIMLAVDKLKPGGWLVLDNAERPRYKRGIDLMSDWYRLDFHCEWVTWLTSMFQKPEVKNE